MSFYPSFSDGFTDISSIRFMRNCAGFKSAAAHVAAMVREVVWLVKIYPTASFRLASRVRVVIDDEVGVE